MGRKISFRHYSNFLFEAQLVDESEFEGNIANSVIIRRRLNLKTDEVRRRIKIKQAVKSDYIAPYQQGHLRPHGGCGTPAGERATYTFTNIVPQVGDFNNGVWKSVEIQGRKFIHEFCRYNNHVVVGAVPSNSQSNNRVTIPSFMWSYVKCARDVIVFLAPNIKNVEIKTYQLLIVFFTNGEHLKPVLQAIQRLGGKDRTDDPIIQRYNITFCNGNGKPCSITSSAW